MISSAPMPVRDGVQPRPSSVDQALLLLCMSVSMEFGMFLSHPYEIDDSAVGPGVGQMVLFFVVKAVAIVLLARGLGWVRYAYLAGFVLSILLAAPDLPYLYSLPRTAVASTANLALQIVALTLLLREPASGWYRTRRG